MTPQADKQHANPPNRVVDPVHPKGWALIPTTTVPDAIHLEAVLRAVWEPEASSWISPDGRHYAVTTRHGDAVVDIYEAGPTEWGCSCKQSHEVGVTDNLCDAVLMVAMLRGDLVRRKER